jgi:phospholipid-translocating ATPase
MDGVALCELNPDPCHDNFNKRLRSAFDYIYVLLWNSVWTIAPVIGIGLFDRILGNNTRYSCTKILSTDNWTDAHLLMAIPELYHYGRRGTWFNLKSFFIYMLDGFVQVRIRYHCYGQSNLHMPGYNYLFPHSLRVRVTDISQGWLRHLPL